MGTGGQKAALIWTAVFGGACGAFLGLGIAHYLKLDDPSTSSAIASGGIAAAATIIVGCLAFVTGGRQTRAVIERDNALRNRDIAKALYAAKDSIIYTMATSVLTVDRLAEWKEEWLMGVVDPTSEDEQEPEIDPREIVPDDELPTLIKIPEAAFWSHNDLGSRCNTARTIGRAVRFHCGRARTAAIKLHERPTNPADVERQTDAIDHHQRHVHVHAAQLSAIATHMLINANEIYESKSLDTELKRLPIRDVASIAKRYNVKFEEVAEVVSNVMKDHAADET